MSVLLATIHFSDTFGIGAVAIAMAIALASFASTRGDKRYEIASQERNEYRERADRLAGRLAKAEEKGEKLDGQVHDLQLEVSRLTGEISRLSSFPDVKELTEKIDHLIELHERGIHDG